MSIRPGRSLFASHQAGFRHIKRSACYLCIKKKTQKNKKQKQNKAHPVSCIPKENIFNPGHTESRNALPLQTVKVDPDQLASEEF